MKLKDIFKKRPYIFLVIVTVILSLLNYNKKADKFSELSIELIKGLPAIILLIETQKKRFIIIVSEIYIFYLSNGIIG